MPAFISQFLLSHHITSFVCGCISLSHPHGKGCLTFWGFLGHITKAVLGQQVVMVPQKMFLDGLVLRLHGET